MSWIQGQNRYSYFTLSVSHTGFAAAHAADLPAEIFTRSNTRSCQQQRTLAATDNLASDIANALDLSLM